MSANKYKMFMQLYSRNMDRVSVDSLGLAGVAIILILLGLTPWSKNLVIVPLIIVTGVAMMLPILTSVLSLHQEWRENTIYLLLSLPVGGASVLGAKLLAALTQLVINGVIIAVMLVVCGYELLPREGVNWQVYWEQAYAAWQYADLSRLLPFVIIMGVLFTMYIVSSLQLGLLIGKLFRRFTGIATIGGIVGVFWLGSNLYSAMLSLLPPLAKWPGASVGSQVPNLDLVLSAVFMLTLVAIIFAASVYIYNHRLEA